MRQPLCLLLMSDKFSKKIEKKSIKGTEDPLKDQKTPEIEEKHHFIHSEIKIDFSDLGLKVFSNDDFRYCSSYPLNIIIPQKMRF